VREETQEKTICGYCNLPITQEQLPSVKLEDGREFHRECWDEFLERGRLM
jgi:hypothetical protein